MTKILRFIKKILDIIFGSRADLWYWKFRHFIDPKWAESYISNESLAHPHRKLLVATVEKYTPIHSAFEIGCASGPNLFLLAQKFPDAVFSGIDISPSAVEKGAVWLAEKNIENISLIVGGFDFLSTLPDKSFDIVLSDATLLYADPKQVRIVIQNMIRIAKKAIILVEQHTDGKSFYNSHWVHNYKDIVPDALFTRIPSDVWGGDWGKYGYIIEIPCIKK